MSSKKILFQGSGYRILYKDDLNVILETKNQENIYKFQGYYTDIQRALNSLVRRDMLIDRSCKLGASDFLKELERVKQQILFDIDSHLNQSTIKESDLSLDDLLQ